MLPIQQREDSTSILFKINTLIYNSTDKRDRDKCQTIDYRYIRDEVHSISMLLDPLPVFGELMEHLHRVGGDVNMILLSPGLYSHQDNPGIELLLVNLRVDNRTGAGGKHWVRHAQSVIQSQRRDGGRGGEHEVSISSSWRIPLPFSFPRAKTKNNSTTWPLLQGDFNPESAHLGAQHLTTDSGDVKILNSGDKFKTGLSKVSFQTSQEGMGWGLATALSKCSTTRWSCSIGTVTRSLDQHQQRGGFPLEALSYDKYKSPGREARTWGPQGGTACTTPSILTTGRPHSQCLNCLSALFLYFWPNS